MEADDFDREIATLEIVTLAKREGKDFIELGRLLRQLRENGKTRSPRCSHPA